MEIKPQKNGRHYKNNLALTSHQPNFEIYIDEKRFKTTKWVHNDTATKYQTVKGTNSHMHIDEKKYQPVKIIKLFEANTCHLQIELGWVKRW